jgi:hypothetical protein
MSLAMMGTGMIELHDKEFCELFLPPVLHWHETGSVTLRDECG